jgi:rubrerythrin
MMNVGLVPVFMLSPMDVLDFAVQFEKLSVNFYDSLASLMKSSSLKELFSLFAGEEAKHIAVFQKMITEADRASYDKKSIPEHVGYLHHFINTGLFSKEILSEKLKRVRDIESTFEFIMSMELDQILFYNEIRDSLLEKDKGLIDEIIVEERRHFVRVMQLKQIKGY